MGTWISAAGAGQCFSIISLDTKPTPPSHTSGGWPENIVQQGSFVNHMAIDCKMISTSITQLQIYNEIIAASEIVVKNLT